MIYRIPVLEAIYRYERYDDVKKSAGERSEHKRYGMKEFAFVDGKEFCNRRLIRQFFLSDITDASLWRIVFFSAIRNFADEAGKCTR